MYLFSLLPFPFREKIGLSVSIREYRIKHTIPLPCADIEDIPQTRRIAKLGPQLAGLKIFWEDIYCQPDILAIVYMVVRIQIILADRDLLRQDKLIPGTSYFSLPPPKIPISHCGS